MLLEDSLCSCHWLSDEAEKYPFPASQRPCIKPGRSSSVSSAITSFSAAFTIYWRSAMPYTLIIVLCSVYGITII